jgi:hypothetical protein
MILTTDREAVPGPSVERPKKRRGRANDSRADRSLGRAVEEA